ncbi:acyloxyacyl hydrolase [Oceanisphaera avium]|uniref:Acyloxyacyl hydrolase n=1 Tax=Oceanisphaera avium TaxID=1903694 RepID=A0A1Y0CTU9_9GAMM|nr:acyloxyacyl hydrolase [Oceanisphaera avium]ART78781.1 hypothetical protein CBP12_00295 [Oceanisphaera avium]
MTLENNTSLLTARWQRGARSRRLSALVIAAVLLSPLAAAENSLRVGGGGGYGAHTVQIGGQWTQQWQGRLSYGVLAEAAAWHATHHDLVQLSLVPLLQYNFMPNATWQPVLLVGVGPAWISDTQLGERDLSSAFQFSSRAGIGLVKERHSLMVEARHLSNAGIKQPNQGISYWNLSYGYRF